MFERFTDGTRRVVVLSQEKCREFHDTEIRSEHFLLALVEDDPATAAGFERAGVSAHGIRQVVAARHRRRRNEPSGHVPFTRNAKQALENSLREAQRLQLAKIPPAVLLLGVLSVEDSGAVAVLRSFDVDIAALTAAAETTARQSTPDDSRSASFGRPVPGRGSFLGLAHAVRRYGRHDLGCPGAADCSCGLQRILDALPPEHY